MLNIFFLGMVSFFADLSTEMVYPLIPLYLTLAFGATPAIVGIIEGVAESAASLLKVFSGYISDRYQNKKALAFWDARNSSSLPSAGGIGKTPLRLEAQRVKTGSGFTMGGKAFIL